VTARELYDHATDPAETRNVIAAPPDAAALAEAEKLLIEEFPRAGYR
jgi:hypothetical protein